MSEDESKSDALAQFSGPELHAVSFPYITRVINANSRRPTLVGGGHARHRVRIVDAHTHETLSSEHLMDGGGQFTLTVNKDLPSGENCLVVILWDAGDWYLSTPIAQLNTLSASESDEDVESIEFDHRPPISSAGESTDDGNVKPLLSPPYFTLSQGTRFDGTDFWVGGHARCTVLIMDAHTFQVLTGQGNTGDGGGTTLRLNYPLAPGVHDLMISLTGSSAQCHSKALRVVVLPQPVITTQSIQLPGVISGRDGVAGATMEIWEDHGSRYAEEQISTSNWNVNVKSLPRNPIWVTCRQYFPKRRYLGSTFSEYAVPKEVKVLSLYVPKITFPAENQEHDFFYSVSGSGAAPGERVVLMSDDETKQYGVSKIVGTDGFWQVDYNFTDHGTLKVKAKLQSVSNAPWSEVRTFRVVVPFAIPEIERPDESSIQNSTFTLWGGRATVGAKIQVLISGTDKIVGETGVLSATNWSCDVASVPHGSTTLTARSIRGTEESERSVARTFKIRPSALTAVNVSYPTGTSVKFSGVGIKEARIRITIVSGPGGTAPPVAVVTSGGNWDTTANNWLIGSYSLKVIQEVPDNANGWIESLSYSFPAQLGIPDPSELKFTKDYQPTFSGKGYTGATVTLIDYNTRVEVAPRATVRNGQWSSQASNVWGPTFERTVEVQQSHGTQYSNKVNLPVTIPPLAPGLDEPGEGISPTFKGTCWRAATGLSIKFSDSPTVHPVNQSNGTWTFTRGTPFAWEVNHTVTVTQTVGSQTSPSASKSFIRYEPIPKPVITYPQANSEVGRNITVKGVSGLKGAAIQLRDARFGGNLGAPKTLDKNGDWSIDLSKLEFRKYTIDAQQTKHGRYSDRSEYCEFTVVLLPPEITVPMENDNLPRTSTLEGSAMSGGLVSVWLLGATEPLQTNIPVDKDGRWKVEVTLPVGNKTIWATQTFENETSKQSQRLNYNVVPASPFIESPTKDMSIGRRTVVSGFAFPGDTITVKLGRSPGTLLGTTVVLDDRTWSVTLEFDLPGGLYNLVAMASCDGFESADSPERPVTLGTYLPSIDEPTAGRWVSDPVGFGGKGRLGIGRVVSWYNPDLGWVNNIRVTAEGWQGGTQQSLPPGGNWVRFRQNIDDDVDGETVSDFVDSPRFEVVPPTEN